MWERIIFNLLAFSLFLIVFVKMIQKNDTNYIYLLALQALGILIAFVALIAQITLSMFLLICTYILSVFLPIGLLLLEKKGILLSELICEIKVAFAKLTDKEEKAKKDLLALLEKYPQSFMGHKLLAQIYEKEEKNQTAIEEYMRAVEQHPKEDNLYLKIAELMHKEERGEQAKEILVELLKRKPDNEKASCLLGDILYENEQLKEAVNVYLEALKYHPENYDLYYNLGMVYTRLNDFQSAKEYYEKAAQLNSLLYQAKYSLAQIALIYNELDEAREYFMECINGGFLEDLAYYTLAYIAMLKGEEENAVEYLNVAVQENTSLYEKARKEPLFQYIIKKINKPNKDGKQMKWRKQVLTKKEKQVLMHLQNTYELVGSLNHNDIKAIRTIKLKRKEEQEKGNNQKEREK